MPDCAVGADVMTGFPGETEAEFEESRRFIESLPFTYLHVFTYSERPGTPAAESTEQVPMSRSQAADACFARSGGEEEFRISELRCWGSQCRS
jgi:tRNA A37 methylthiotransferase MiaB